MKFVFRNEAFEHAQRASVEITTTGFSAAGKRLARCGKS
jgi:hypothetical protein